jgi:hypothetical protein
MVQNDGVALVFQGNNILIAYEVPTDRQDDTDISFKAFSRRITSLLDMLRDSHAARVSWAGLIATFQQPDAEATGQLDAPQQWATRHNLPFSRQGKMAAFQSTIGYELGGYNKLVTVLGFENRSFTMIAQSHMLSPSEIQRMSSTAKVVSAGLEIAVDVNDRPKNDPSEIDDKLKSLRLELFSFLKDEVVQKI